MKITQFENVKANGWPFRARILLFVILMLLSLTSYAAATVTLTPNVPTYPFQVLANSTRQINVQEAGGTANTINWSVISATGGATATFTTPAATAASSVSAGLPTVQVNIGPTAGNCSISGSSGNRTVSSTATVTVQAQAVDNPAVTATFLFNVCANQPATLANGTSSVIVAPAYQQAFQDQPMTLQSWVVGCVNENGTWAIASQPAGGNGALADTTNRDTVFTASVTGRYTIEYTSTCTGGTSSAIVYVSPNALPSYAATPNETRPHECYPDPALSGADYEIGAGKAYTHIYSTPNIASIEPGTIYRLWNTDTTGANPSVYNEYFEIANSGTATQPIIFCGVPDAEGNLPIMDGNGAKGPTSFNNSALVGTGIFTLFPANFYGYWQAGSAGPSYISITGLHLRNANPNYSYTPPGGGAAVAWTAFVACANIESGSFIDVSGNEMDSCPLGIFSDDNDSNAWATVTQNITAMGNHMTNNGWSGSEGEHSVYLQSFYTLFEGNRLDNYNPTAQGSHIKWRGVEGIFRYNFLGFTAGAAGPQRDFDMVDDSDAWMYATFEGYLGSQNVYDLGDTAGANVIAAYQESAQKDFAYGNIIQGNAIQGGQIHYAEDQGSGMNDRNGILHFYSNTLDDAQEVFDTGQNGDGYDPYFPQRIDARNNIIWAGPAQPAGDGIQLGAYASIIMDSQTNLFETGSVSAAIPIEGTAYGYFYQGGGDGWAAYCDGTCQWQLTVPLDPHLYDLTDNYLFTSTQPYSPTTYVPVNGSAAEEAGTPLTKNLAMSGSVLATMPVRWQYSTTTDALTPRLDPLTVGAEDYTGEVDEPTAATPSFSPPGGTYAATQTVTISSATSGAAIYYTTNGSTPTTSSTLYSGPVTVSTSETIEAIAVASGYSDSAVGSATYTIGLSAATPTFSPAAGTYTSAQTVTISSSTPDATIYYTTNGTTPTTSSTVYSGPITVSTSETIEAIATASGDSASAVGTAVYTINLAAAATPTFSPGAGTYTSAQTVTISSSTAGAAIYYTTNGSTPTTSSTLYTGPVTVSASETLEAIATASGYSTSAVGSAAYTIDLTTATPGFSLTVSPTALSVTAGQSGAVSVQVTPLNSFSSPVSFSCTNLPAGASCSFAPAAVTPAGAVATTTLTVTTSTTTASLHRNSTPWFPGSVLAVAFCCFGWKKRRALQVLAVLVAATLSMCSGCGGVIQLTPGGSTTQQQTVTVVATSGSLQQTATFTLTVQ